MGAIRTMIKPHDQAGLDGDAAGVGRGEGWRARAASLVARAGTGHRAYIRVSSDRQERMETAETQLDAFDAHTRALNIAFEKIYIDEDYSGELPLEDRPDSARLLKDAAREKFTLHVFKLDRLARGTLNQLMSVQALADLGVPIVSVTEPYLNDATSRGARVLRVISALQSEEELENLSVRVRAGQQRSAKAGRWTNGPPPYGYVKGRDGRLEPHPHESTVVALIFSLYCSGLSTQAVADALNERGEPQPRGGARTQAHLAARPWYDSTVLNILKNETYAGRGVWGRTRNTKRRGRLVRVTDAPAEERVYFEVPALVTREQWDEAQARCKANTKFSARNSHRFYLLKGLLACGVCGRGYTGHANVENAYYHCSSQGRHRRGIASCGNKPVRADLLDEYVWSVIEAYAMKPDDYVQENEERFTRSFDDEASLRNEIARAAARVSKLREGRARVLRFMRLGPEEGGVSEEEGSRELLSLRKEIETAEGRAADLEDRRTLHERMRRSVASGREVLEKLQARVLVGERPPDRERAEIVRALIHRRIIISKKSSPGGGGGGGGAVADVSLVWGEIPDCADGGLKRYGSISSNPSERYSAMAERIVGSVSSRMRSYPIARASSTIRSASVRPSPVPRKAGRAYSRFISHTASSTLRRATQPAAASPS